jgi:hypothetical protein
MVSGSLHPSKSGALGAAVGFAAAPLHRVRFERRFSMSDDDGRRKGVDKIAILFILGGIPAIVAFAVILFTLVHLFPSIPA